MWTKRTLISEKSTLFNIEFMKFEVNHCGDIIVPTMHGTDTRLELKMKENEWFSFGLQFSTNEKEFYVAAYNADKSGSSMIFEDKNIGSIPATFEYGSTATRTNKFTGFIFSAAFLVGDYFDLLAQIYSHPSVDCSINEYLNFDGDCCQCHHTCS